jgi:hypothetical protein
MNLMPYIEATFGKATFAPGSGVASLFPPGYQGSIANLRTYVSERLSVFIIALNWDNPFIGSNSYSEAAPEPYEAFHVGGSGNNAVVVFRLIGPNVETEIELPGPIGPDPSTQTGLMNTNDQYNRNVIVILLNNTNDTTLFINASSEASGAQSSGYPSQVLPGTAVEWSDFATNLGVQGFVTFHPFKAGELSNITSNVVVNWDNPYVGSNSYSCTVPPGYNISYQGGDGDTAVVIFNLMEE